jgi:hypothetical protein
MHTRDSVALLPDDSWVTPHEAALFLGVTIRLMAEWRSAGVGPSYAKPTRLVRYQMASLRAYMRARVRVSA